LSGTYAVNVEHKREGMKLPSLETASFWSNIAVVVLTLLAACAGVLALYFGTKLGAAKDAEVSVAIASANARSAEANRKSAEASEGTAKAEVDAARANERAGVLEVQAANQRIRAAHAETELLELKYRLAPRRITREQHGVYVEMLKPYGGSKVEMTQIGDIEAKAFAADILSVLTDSGWDVQVNFIAISAPPRYGVTGKVDARTNAGKALFEFLSALPDSAVVAAPPQIGGLASVFIGLKTPR
jgi:hypothetical protein